MVRTSILEKLTILKDLILTDAFFMVIMLGFIVLALILLYLTRFPKKVKLPLCLSIYATIIISIIIKYHSSFLSIIDYLINNVFLVLVFPNIAVYGLVIVLTNIILIFTIIGNNTNIKLKKLNIICYCLIMFLLFLVLNVIVSNEIDVYSASAIYTNNTLFTLIELNMSIFIIWLLLILIFMGIEKLTTKNNLEISLDVPLPTTDVLPLEQEDNYVDINNYDNIEVIDELDIKQPEKIIDLSNYDNIEILDFEEPTPKVEKNQEPFTLDEYKMLANMLRNQRSL